MTMRTRKIVIWLSVIVVGAPIAIMLLDDISIFVDNFAIIASALLILSLSVTGWRLRRRLKIRMKEGLGRDVQDEELTSIGTWMKIPDQAARAGREAGRYDFDD